ncbi:geminin-like [Adelges cooleyi]|uniref:geminin-like n=1 Tax=Adelges cooleyi TaxID=133065 RepID=UPI00218086D0|nr:geminin-like [Adelges cooleyi]XP_050438545.1 geminin-like [Adelges cooleyi]XP_050438546.1 geminin-like [Adelges cooleyi]XP_050438547.1 geminin-like [Adelges cooleyi]
MKTTSVALGDLETDKATDKGMRKFLQNLQPSSGGKENLVGVGRIPQESTNAKTAIKPEQVFTDMEVKMKDKKDKLSIAKVNPSLYKKLIIEDLTSTAGPSEKYWEVIAERRRKALEEVLDENRKLRDLVTALEKENASCKQLLENTTDLVNTLKDVINESYMDDDEEETKSGQGDNNQSSPESSPSEKHVHKKMKTLDSDSDSH